MITVEHITKKFVRNKNKKEKEVFLADNDINFEANDGEIIGILGPNGAGNCGSAISAGHRCRRSGRPAQR